MLHGSRRQIRRLTVHDAMLSSKATWPSLVVSGGGTRAGSVSTSTVISHNRLAFQDSSMTMRQQIMAA